MHTRLEEQRQAIAHIDIDEEVAKKKQMEVSTNDAIGKLDQARRAFFATYAAALRRTIDASKINTQSLPGANVALETAMEGARDASSRLDQWWAEIVAAEAERVAATTRLEQIADELGLQAQQIADMKKSLRTNPAQDVQQLVDARIGHLQLVSAEDDKPREVQRTDPGEQQRASFLRAIRDLARTGVPADKASAAAEEIDKALQDGKNNLEVLAKRWRVPSAEDEDILRPGLGVYTDDGVPPRSLVRGPKEQVVDRWSHLIAGWFLLGQHLTDARTEQAAISPLSSSSAQSTQSSSISGITNKINNLNQLRTKAQGKDTATWNEESQAFFRQVWADLMKDAQVGDDIVTNWQDLFEQAGRAMWARAIRDNLAKYPAEAQELMETAGTVKVDTTISCFTPSDAALQVEFFRPDRREAGFLAAAINTCFYADPDELRAKTSLPALIWKTRLTELDERIKAAGTQKQQVAGFWTNEQRREMLLKVKDGRDVALAAVKWALRDFVTRGPIASQVAPALLLERLLWAMLTSAEFLQMRRRYTFDPFSSERPLFRKLRSAHRVITGQRYIVVDENTAHDLMLALVGDSPRALDTLKALGEKEYRWPRESVYDLWRVLLFGRIHDPSVLVAAPARDGNFPLDTREAFDLVNFLVDFDAQIYRAVDRLDKQDAAALKAVERQSLVHACFVWFQAYLVDDEVIFAQQQHPDGQVLFDYFHGQAVMEIAREVYGCNMAARPIDWQWYTEWHALVESGLIYDQLIYDQEPTPWDSVLDNNGNDFLATPGEAQGRFMAWVMQPAVNGEPRVLWRYARSSKPFSASTDLEAGSARCWTLIEDQLEWKDLSPTAGLNLQASLGYPEGEDAAYDPDEFSDFPPVPEYSFFEWRVGRQLYLRPSVASRNTIDLASDVQTITAYTDGDSTKPVTQPLASSRTPVLAMVTHAHLFPELFPRNTPFLQWYHEWWRLGWRQHISHERIDQMVDIASKGFLAKERLTIMDLDPQRSRIAQTNAQYAHLQAELKRLWWPGSTNQAFVWKQLIQKARIVPPRDIQGSLDDNYTIPTELDATQRIAAVATASPNPGNVRRAGEFDQQIVDFHLHLVDVQSKPKDFAEGKYARDARRLDDVTLGVQVYSDYLPRAIALIRRELDEAQRIAASSQAVGMQT